VHFSNQGLTPFLKWAGGKRWFINQYARLLQPFVGGRRIVEAFAGAGAFSLKLSPQKALLNDVNPHLINLYRQIQQGTVLISADISLTKEYYYSLRTEFNGYIVAQNYIGASQARLFWLLNRLGYNGLCRFNKKGFFNTPAGRYKKIHTGYDWSAYKSLFDKWEFSLGSYDTLCIQPDDFIFCDPPYDTSWQGYYHNQFSFEEQQHLASWVVKQQVPVILMNAPTSRIVELYEDSGFEIHYLTAPRTLAAESRSRKKCVEVIATHNFSWKDLTKNV
jgi:DNA adenine methylase